MGGAWSSCLPCASGGAGGGGASISGATPEAKKLSNLQKYHQDTLHEHHHRGGGGGSGGVKCANFALAGERAPLGDLDEDLDEEREGDISRALHQQQVTKQTTEDEDESLEDYEDSEELQLEGAQQSSRVSPRLHDIEEEGDDEEGRNTRERSAATFRNLHCCIYIYKCRIDVLFIFFLM